MKSIKFQFKGNKFVIKDYNICDNILSKTRGLMFRRKSYEKPLLFTFAKPGSYPIHSFFCRKFIAVWMLNSSIIDVKLVEPWKINVTPKEKFNFLLEVPIVT